MGWLLCPMCVPVAGSSPKVAGVARAARVALRPSQTREEPPVTDDEALLADPARAGGATAARRLRQRQRVRARHGAGRARAAARHGADRRPDPRVHQQLFHVALPGTTVDNDHWIRRKNAAVYRFGRSSFYLGVSCRVRGLSLAERYLGRPARVRGPRRRVPDPGARHRPGRHDDRLGPAAGRGSPAGRDHARAFLARG